MRDDGNPTGEPAGDEDTIRKLVVRLGRPHKSGGTVIERASLLASGGDFRAAIAWIEEHGGAPEAAVASRTDHGVHGARFGGGTAREQAPLRFILPAAALR